MDQEDIDSFQALARHYMAQRDMIILFFSAFQRVQPEQATLVRQALEALLASSKAQTTNEFLDLSKTMRAVLDGRDDTPLLSAKHPGPLTREQLREILTVYSNPYDNPSD